MNVSKCFRSASGDVTCNSRASDRPGTSCRWSHNVFHSPTREYGHCKQLASKKFKVTNNKSVMSSSAKHENFKLHFQVLQINWTGMTNLLDGPGLR